MLGGGVHIKIFLPSKRALYLAFIGRGRTKGESVERGDERETHAYTRETKDGQREGRYGGIQKKRRKRNILVWLVLSLKTGVSSLKVRGDRKRHGREKGLWEKMRKSKERCHGFW